MKYLRSYRNYNHHYHPKYEERNFPLIGIICFDEKDHAPVLSYDVSAKIEEETANAVNLIQEMKRRRHINSSSGYSMIRSAELSRRKGLASRFTDDGECLSFSAVASPYVISRVDYHTIANGEYRASSGLTDLYFKHISNVERIDKCAFMDSGIVDINLPKSLEIIGKKSFMNTPIESLNIPNNVQKIGKKAFFNCENLQNLDLGGGEFDLTDDWGSGRIICERAFSRCKSLTSVVIPSGVTKVMRYAFSGCRDLEFVYIGDNVVHLGIGAFQDCYKLNNIAVSENNSRFFVDKNGILCSWGKVTGKNVRVHFIPLNRKKINLSYRNGDSGIVFAHRVFNGMEIDSLRVNSNNFVMFKTGAFGPVSVGFGSKFCLKSKRRLATIKELIIDGFPKIVQFGTGSFVDSGIEHMRITVDTSYSHPIKIFGNNPFVNCENLSLIEIVCSDENVFDNCEQILLDGGVDDSITEIRWVQP